MLRGIHKATSTWVGKAIMAVIMGFLIISFAVWGIGDIFRGFGRNEVARVGGSEITIEQFRRYYNDRLQQVGRQMQRAITPDQARALGLDRQFLGQMIAETTFDEKAKQLRLGLSDADIASRIMADPNFQGPGGQFDRGRFQQVINQAGFTEARYVDEQRRVLLRRQIALSISGELSVPKTALEAVNQYRNQKRSVDYLVLGAAQAGAVPEPTADQIGKYFDERQTLFRAPEYRKITLLSVSVADLAKPEAVTDEDATAYYEQRKAQYGKPERREVRQIVFPTPEEAAAARAKITGGASFDDIAKERNLKASDTDLGLVAKTGLIDTAVADAAFSLKSGEVSQPVQGRFGSVLVAVGKIEPGEQKTYADVSQEIKRTIAESRARTKISELRDKIEDEKASGATLAEISKKLGLKSTTVEAVDRSGRGPDGNPIAALPKAPDVIGAAFGSDVGVDNEALQLPSGGYLYYDVTGITPSRARKLEEVKDKVTASWRDDEIAKRLKAKADEMVAKLKAGGTLEQIASESGLQVLRVADLQRSKPGGFAPAKLVEAAFRTPKDVAASTEGGKETERFVFKVTAVTDANLDVNAAETKSVREQLQSAYADDIVGQYIGTIEKEMGVSINQSALNQVVGGEPGI